MVASSGVRAISWARVFQVPQASPVKAMAEVWSDQGPAANTSKGSSLDEPMRASTKPRWPWFTISWA